MKFDVVTFGSAVVDVFVSTNANEKNKFICYPVGDKILINDLKFDVGGGATNTSVAFSRLGLKTGCICKVGDDNNGRRILKLLNKEKVKFLGKTNAKGTTGYSVILNSKEKGRTVLTYKGVNNEIDKKDINEFKTKWIYCSSLMGKSFETQKKLITSLKKKNVKFAFNPSSYLIRKNNLKELFEACNILILNKEEAQDLVKKDLLIGLHKKIDKEGIVVITDKNNLISCYDGKKKYFLKPNKIKVVERTGAGDAFASGFVAGIIANKSIQESLKLGLKESESVIRYFGAKNKLLKMNLK
jgi:ribokinase